MYRWLAQLLGNISVNRKLSLGFGLVLVLTLLIAATGWNGLVSVIDRGDKLANISQIIGLTKDLRIARLEYERHPEEKTLAEVTRQLTELDNALELSHQQLVSPEDLTLVEQQLNAVAEYKRAFADLIQGSQGADQAVERMHQQGGCSDRAEPKALGSANGQAQQRKPPGHHPADQLRTAGTGAGNDRRLGYYPPDRDPAATHAQDR